MTITTASESDTLTYPVRFNTTEIRFHDNKIWSCLFVTFLVPPPACVWCSVCFQMRGAGRRKSPVTPHHPNKLRPASAFVFRPLRFGAPASSGKHTAIM